MHVKQVAHVLDLIEFFAQRRRPATLAELSEHFGWPRSSAYNILSTLAARGYLYEPEGRGRFYPTARWHALAQDCLRGDPTPEVVIGLMEELAELTAETITVSVPNGGHALRIEVVPSPAAVRYNAEVGSRLPIHVTGSGQALLSFLDAERRMQILRRAVFQKYGEGSPMSVAEVERSIDDSLHRGWFESRSNYSVDLGGVSLPLRINERHLSLTVAGPLFRVAPRMREFATTAQRLIARRLGRGFLASAVPGMTDLTTEPAP